MIKQRTKQNFLIFDEGKYMDEKPRSTHKILDQARTVRAETGRTNEEGLCLETKKRIFQPFFVKQTESQKSTENENLLQITETELDRHIQEQLALYIARLEEREGVKGNFSDQKNWRVTNDPELDMAEEIEREKYEAWEKFRKSDEYQAWKNMEEFAKLEDYEEYVAWSSWIEETGKVDDPRFLAKYFGYEE